MSLFCSLKLIKDANASLSPRPRDVDPVEMTSHIKYNSPRPITSQSFLFPPVESRLRSFSDLCTPNLNA